MNRLLIVLSTVLLFFVTSALHAQEKSSDESQIEIGGGLAFAKSFSGDDFSGVSNFGLMGKARIRLKDELLLSPSIVYFFPNDAYEALSMFSINGDVHYAFELDGFTLYPLAGINFSMARYENEFIGSRSESQLGLNLGGGGMYHITEDLHAFGELKAVIVGDQVGGARGVLSFGVLVSIK